MGMLLSTTFEIEPVEIVIRCELILCLITICPDHFSDLSSAGVMPNVSIYSDISLILLSCCSCIAAESMA